MLPPAKKDTTVVWAFVSLRERLSAGSPFTSCLKSCANARERISQNRVLHFVFDGAAFGLSLLAVNLLCTAVRWPWSFGLAIP